MAAITAPETKTEVKPPGLTCTEGTAGAGAGTDEVAVVTVVAGTGAGLVVGGAELGGAVTPVCLRP
jgi:hypothetical protein